MQQPPQAMHTQLSLRPEVHHHQMSQMLDFVSLVATSTSILQQCLSACNAGGPLEQHMCYWCTTGPSTPPMLSTQSGRLAWGTCCNCCAYTSCCNCCAYTACCNCHANTPCYNCCAHAATVVHTHFAGTLMLTHLAAMALHTHLAAHCFGHTPFCDCCANTFDTPLHSFQTCQPHMLLCLELLCMLAHMLLV